MLITVLPHVFAFMGPFAFLFFLVDKCLFFMNNLSLSEITEWEPCSSLRQSNSQLQNQAALMSRRIRAVEHRKCAAGLVGAHPGLQDRILVNYTRIENAHKVHR